MKTDALNRRLRFAPPNPEQRPKHEPKRIVLTDDDFRILEAINRHGPLPSHYLNFFAPRAKSRHTNRLTMLANGDVDGPVLTLPRAQQDGAFALYSHLVYDLAKRGKLALAERGFLARYSAKRTEHFLHQLMQACVGASLEIACKKVGLRYITREEILRHPKCPETTRAQANPLAMPVFNLSPQKAITPDDLFGIEYPDGKFRFFAVEIDRNTESIERRDPLQNSFGKKLKGYADIMTRGTFRRHFGIPNLHVLTVTTNAAHAENIIAHLKREGGKMNPYFWFQSAPTFGTGWRVPKEVLYQLLSEPWNSTSGERYLYES